MAPMSGMFVNTFVASSVILATAIVALEYVHIRSDELDDHRSDELRDGNENADHLDQIENVQEVRLFLDEYVAPELPKVFRLIGQHWLTPRAVRWLDTCALCLIRRF